MHKGYGSCSVCVCVCYQPSCHIPHLYVESWVSLGFLCYFQCMYYVQMEHLVICVDFMENALFKISGEIC